MSKAGYTCHGHEIPGASVYPPERPKVYRCGGPGLCEVCSRESSAWQAEAKLAKIRELCAKRVSGYPDDPYDFVREFALKVLAILDGDGDE